ncbi:MAG: hypothetical protein QOH95_2192 [Gaiellaceae bacterium]|nr:hypothetical protein [Gaiellaceae bacterium]
MRIVTRGLTILSALLATLAVALPASAADGLTLSGVVVSVSRSAVVFKDARNVATTCLRSGKSPSLEGYAAHDRVQAACARVRGKLVLVRIRHLADAASPPSNDAEPTRFGGVVTALTETSISLHDGDRDLTCTLGASSPSTALVKVGQHVKVSCSNGVLVAVAPVATGDPARAYEGSVTAVSTGSITVHNDTADVTCVAGDGSPSLADLKVGDRVLVGCKTGSNQLVLLRKLAQVGPSPTGRAGSGTIAALAASSITFHNGEHGDATCTVAATSPAVDGYKVGDKVKFGCLDGALVAIAKDGTGTVDGPHKSLGAAGTVSAVSPGSLTVHTVSGEVTCTVGDGSPSLTSLRVGDSVKIGCLDGILKVVVTAPAPVPPSPDPHETKTVGGTLSMLSNSSVTVHSAEKGDVSCSVGASSPHLGDFHVGDHVGMLCVDGVVTKLVKL